MAGGKKKTLALLVLGKARGGRDPDDGVSMDGDEESEPGDDLEAVMADLAQALEDGDWAAAAESFRAAMDVCAEGGAGEE